MVLVCPCSDVAKSFQPRRVEGVSLSKPHRGDKMAVFKDPCLCLNWAIHLSCLQKASQGKESKAELVTVNI